MKKNYINPIYLLAVLFFIISLSTSAGQVRLPDNSYMKFHGNIQTAKNELGITLDLYTTQDSLCEGTYYYDKIRKPIYLSGTINNQGIVQLTERTDNKITGMFSGQFIDQTSITGTWMTPDSSTQFKFSIKENYPPGSARFKISHIHEEVGDCEVENCFAIDIIFPAMVDYQNAHIQRMINHGINADHDKQQDIVQEEIEFFNEESGMYEDIDYPMNWYEYYEEKIMLNSDYILAFERFASNYTGGAHGSHIYDLINFDLQTGDTIFLDDIFVDNYETQLNMIAEQIFRHDNEIRADKDLSEAGYWGFDDGFRVNNNFLLKMDGLSFVFNEYEIAPYAAGAIEVFIPFREVEHLIRPDSPLRSLIK
jgi:hypothetical protein